MCVHCSHPSQEIALLFDLTPFSHTVHGNLTVRLQLSIGPGFGCMSPASISISMRKWRKKFRKAWDDFFLLIWCELSQFICWFMVGDNREYNDMCQNNLCCLLLYQTLKSGLPGNSVCAILDVYGLIYFCQVVLVS